MKEKSPWPAISIVNPNMSHCPSPNFHAVIATNMTLDIQAGSQVWLCKFYFNFMRSGSGTWQLLGTWVLLKYY